MGLAQYSIVAEGNEWGVLHDGNIKNRYATKESAFEAAVAAASLAIREGHEVHISVPDRFAGNQTALGAKDNEGLSAVWSGSPFGHEQSCPWSSSTKTGDCDGSG